MMRWTPDHRFLTAFQPFAIIGDVILTKTRRPETGAAAAVFVSPFGLEHPLRAIPRQMLEGHHRRNNLEPAKEFIRDELQRQAQRAGPLEQFLQVLVPAVSARDEGLPASHRVRAVAAASGVGPFDLDELAQALAAGLPLPHLPAPAIYSGARAFDLEVTTAPIAGRVYIRYGADTYSMTGSVLPVGALSLSWHVEIQSFLAAFSRRLEETMPRVEPDEMARVELDRTGAVERGDLLLILPPAGGEAPRIGHILPRHANRTLGRVSHRDLAIAVRPDRALDAGNLEVYERSPTGRWNRLALPNGLCIGAPPRAVLPEDPVLRIPVFLRWSGVRLASNRRFHQNDARGDDHDRG